MAESLDAHMAWLYSDREPCTCPHKYGSLGRIDHINMGKGWLRMSTAPGCPNHDPRSHPFYGIKLEPWMTPAVWRNHCRACGGRKRDHA